MSVTICTSTFMKCCSGAHTTMMGGADSSHPVSHIKDESHVQTQTDADVCRDTVSGLGCLHFSDGTDSKGTLTFDLLIFQRCNHTTAVCHKQSVYWSSICFGTDITWENNRQIQATSYRIHASLFTAWLQLRISSIADTVIDIKQHNQAENVPSFRENMNILRGSTKRLCSFVHLVEGNTQMCSISAAFYYITLLSAQ